ncbi:uncharacterized protein IL334_005152 [Kwoniella shivajii]|uniref:RTA1-domain-containing protein n=1 Tax=Kwoniella shivajii TaxID=564305 RepID=A0ABZ1D3J8_9TREE|nr:hypothetical protein IL334_005152 [Kwoniella shivajii]
MECYVQKFNNGTLAPFQCNNVNGSHNLITGVLEYSEYGYEPSHAFTYLFIALFGIGFVAHTLLAVYWRTWWCLPTLAAGAAVETIGWGGRVWSIISWVWSPNEGGLWFTEFNSFIIQIVCLVIGPTFFSAANYILLGKLIVNAGPSYISLHNQSFSTLFIIADVVCLVIQGAGGGIAGTANTSAGSDNGAYIMTGGVVLQLVITVIYIGFFTEWIWRRSHDRPAPRQYNPFSRFHKKKANVQLSPSATLLNESSASDSPSIGMTNMKPEDGYSAANTAPVRDTPHMISEKKIKLMCGLIILGTSLIVVRSLYRSVELTNGWDGAIARNEALFLGLDALLMALFVIAYGVIHPGLVFGKRLF